MVLDEVAPSVESTRASSSHASIDRSSRAAAPPTSMPMVAFSSARLHAFSIAAPITSTAEAAAVELSIESDTKREKPYSNARSYTSLLLAELRACSFSSSRTACSCDPSRPCKNATIAVRSGVRRACAELWFGRARVPARFLVLLRRGLARDVVDGAAASSPSLSPHINK